MITIENCTFAFRCPKNWHFLPKLDDDPKVRFCSTCKRAVHYCEIDDELMARVRAGDCVAIARAVDPQTGHKETYLGDVAYSYDPPSLLSWD